MTRDEFKKEHGIGVFVYEPIVYESSDVEEIIDNLYDKFESEYKTLLYVYENERYWRNHCESKCGVCGTCKYFHDGKYPDDRYCDKDISMCEEFSLLERNFGCNLWEKKDET